MRINKILTELIIIFLTSKTNKSLRLTKQSITITNNLVNGTILNFYTDSFIEISSYFVDKELGKGYFFLYKSDINTLESNILFKKILLQDDSFKEELISILEKELLNEN